MPTLQHIKKALQTITFGLLLGFYPNTLLLVCSQHPGLFMDKICVHEKIPIEAYCFDLCDVKLLDSPFYQNMERNGKWLSSIDNNRLLHSYRINAGIPSKGGDPDFWASAKAYGGWERLDIEVRGHTLGHVLSGLALMYASTGNIKFKYKGDSLVTALAECQVALDRNGYISAFPEHFITRVITGQWVWSPWYVIHKIYAGLLDMYLYADNDEALAVLIKAAEWVNGRVGNLKKEQLAIMLKIEFGGMNEVFYNLYAVTGNPEHKKIAECFYDHTVLDPLVAMTDKLSGLHANTLIPKIIGEARAYELTGCEKNKTTAEFFWKTVIDNHTYANGGNSNNEIFFEPGQLSRQLSPRTAETCNTYNMLKLTRHLFEWTANAEYADYYETALYNHILASQDPNTGMVCYYTPLTPGSFKVYSTPENSFWCCVGTGFENHAKYAEGIYYHNDQTLYVNLFIPSELDWKPKGLKIKQETSFPETDKTTISFEKAPAEELSLAVRYPSWAVKGTTVRVNERKIRVLSKPGSYITLTRKWKAGDKVEIIFPMSLRLIPTNDNPMKAAIAYGPILLAGAMGTEGLLELTPYADKHDAYINHPIPANMVHELRLSQENLSQRIIPEANKPLRFITTEETADDVVHLMPFSTLHHQRYVVYWDLKKD